MERIIRSKLVMDKIKKIIIATAFLCSLIMNPVAAKNIEGDIYQICKNDIFVDFDQLNCKKIITEVRDTGYFRAMNLGDWLKEKNIYDISVMEENAEYKKLFYERGDNDWGDEFYDSKDAAYVDFERLVQAGDVINYTDTSVEIVTEVGFDGSFYTQVESIPSLPFSENDLTNE